MKKNFLIVIIIFFSKIAFSQITYTFIGNGKWSVASNWSNNTIPPTVLPAGSTINLSPATGDSCVLDTSQTISPGAYLNIFAGANLIIRGNISSNLLIQDSTFTDSRDGQVYTFRQIGTQVWMTKNLNYAAPGSWCYNDFATNCGTYGRLYDWFTARTVAPPGWHLPSDAEWTILTTFLGGEAVAGGKMKSITAWNLPNIGATNSSGFTGLPGGFRNYEGGFGSIGNYGAWWSSSDYGTPNGWSRAMNSFDPFTLQATGSKSSGFSVRCVRN